MRTLTTQFLFFLSQARYPAGHRVTIALIRIREFTPQGRLFIVDNRRMKYYECESRIEKQRGRFEQQSLSKQYEQNPNVHRVSDMPIQALDHKIFGWRNRGGSPFAQKREAPGTPQIELYSDNNRNQTKESERASFNRKQFEI